jgi:protein TonB
VRGDFIRIILFSLLFHFLIAILVGCALFVRPQKPPHKVPVVELITPPSAKAPPVVEPEPEIEPEPEPEPEIKKELPPQVKAKKEKPKKKKPKKKKVKKKKPKKKKPKKKKPKIKKPDTPKKDSVVVDDDDWGDEVFVKRTFKQTKAEKVRISSYKSRIQGVLKRRFNPIDGQKEHYKKYSTIEFKIYRNGAVVDVSLVRSSGESFIDKAALGSFTKGRLEGLPKEFNGQYMPFSIDLIYDEID